MARHIAISILIGICFTTLWLNPARPFPRSSHAMRCAQRDVIVLVVLVKGLPSLSRFIPLLFLYDSSIACDDARSKLPYSLIVHRVVAKQALGVWLYTQLRSSYRWWTVAVQDMNGLWINNVVSASKLGRRRDAWGKSHQIQRHFALDESGPVRRKSRFVLRKSYHHHALSPFGFPFALGYKPIERLHTIVSFDEHRTGSPVIALASGREEDLYYNGREPGLGCNVMDGVTFSPSISELSSASLNWRPSFCPFGWLWIFLK